MLYFLWMMMNLSIMNSMSYYLYRLRLTINGWKYWMFTPYEDLQKITSPYTPDEIYWSIREGGHTISANFWYMVNDGYYDMIDEWEDL